MSEKQIIVIRESLAKSLARDLFTVSSLTAMVGIGVVLESAAMQWIGAACWLLMAFARGSGRAKPMTAEQAIEFINSGKQS